jgi:hypothetical protein
MSLCVLSVIDQIWIFWTFHARVKRSQGRVHFILRFSTGFTTGFVLALFLLRVYVSILVRYKLVSFRFRNRTPTTSHGRFFWNNVLCILIWRWHEAICGSRRRHAGRSSFYFSAAFSARVFCLRLEFRQYNFDMPQAQQDEHYLPVFVSPNQLTFYLRDPQSHRQIMTVYNPYDFAVSYEGKKTRCHFRHPSKSAENWSVLL